MDKAARYMDKYIDRPNNEIVLFYLFLSILSIEYSLSKGSGYHMYNRTIKQLLLLHFAYTYTLITVINEHNYAWAMTGQAEVIVGNGLGQIG